MIKLALQLYTVRNEIKNDLEGTLAAIAAVGYSGIELGGNYFGMEPSELKALLDKYGLKVVSSHVSYKRMVENLMEEVNYVKALGANYITIPCLPDEMRKDELSVLHAAAAMDDMARKAKQKGISLSYHNHTEEFLTVFNNRNIEQILIDEAPNLNFEIDTGWAGVAGVDNKEFLTKLGYRVDLVHIKDVNNDNIPVEIGEGRLNMKAVFDTVDKMAIRWAIVEQDKMMAYPALESIKVSYDNIQEKYIKFLEK